MAKISKGSAKVEHGTAKAPPPKTSTEGTAPRFSVENTPRHMLLKMGMNAHMVSPGAKTRS